MRKQNSSVFLFLGGFNYQLRFGVLFVFGLSLRRQFTWQKHITKLTLAASFYAKYK